MSGFEEVCMESVLVSGSMLTPNKLYILFGSGQLFQVVCE